MDNKEMNTMNNNHSQIQNADNPNTLNPTPKEKIGCKWWFALFGGILMGIIVFVAGAFALSGIMYARIDSDFGNSKPDKKLRIVDASSLSEGDLSISFVELKSGDVHADLIYKVVNHSDKDYFVYSASLSVNGYIFPSTLAEDVKPYGSKEFSITLPNDFSKKGIQKVTHIEQSFMVRTQDYKSDPKILGPIMLKSNYAGKYRQDEEDSKMFQNVIYEQDGIKISTADLKIYDKKRQKQQFGLVFENSTDNLLTFRSIDLLVNGYHLSDSFFPIDDLPPHTKTKTFISLSLDDVVEKRIGENFDSVVATLEVSAKNPITEKSIQSDNNPFRIDSLKIK